MMTVFETKRLVIKSIKEKDYKIFAELLSNPEILNLIPQAQFSEAQIRKRFTDNLNLEQISDQKTSVFGVYEKESLIMIGFCLFIINDEGNRELGYRFRVKYWGKGYGTETAEGTIGYCFEHLGVDKVTADVNVENKASVNILEKFMTPVREFFNERDNCVDRRYEIVKKKWLNVE